MGRGNGSNPTAATKGRLPPTQGARTNTARKYTSIMEKPVSNATCDVISPPVYNNRHWITCEATDTASPSENKFFYGNNYDFPPAKYTFNNDYVSYSSANDDISGIFIINSGKVSETFASSNTTSD